MLSSQHTKVCDIEQVKRRPAPIRVSPWKEYPKGEPVCDKMDKKRCGEKPQFLMDEDSKY